MFEWSAFATVALMLAGVAVLATALSVPIGPLLVLAAAAPFVAMIVGDLRRLLLGVVILDIAFQWDVHLGYREAEAQLGAVGGFNLSITTLALAGLYALWLAELLAVPERAASPRLRWALPAIAYVGLTAGSVVVARDAMLARFELALLLQMLLLYVYVASTVRTRRDVRFLAGMLVVALLLQSVVMLTMRYSGLDLSPFGFSSQARPGSGLFLDRVTGTFGSPNAAGSFLLLLLLVAITLLAAPVGRRLKAVAVAAFVIGLTALVLTFSRGGWIGFAIAMTIAGVAAWRRGWLSRRVWIALAVGTALLLVVFGATIAGRVTNDDRGAARSRVPLMRLAGEIIEDHPLLGVGANNFGVVIREYAGPDYTQEWLYTVHNKYLLVWAEAGIGALLAFLWFLAVAIRRGWHCWRSADPLLSPLALGLTAGSVGYAVHMTVDMFNGRQPELLWLAAGLLTAMYGLVRHERREPSRRRARRRPAASAAAAPAGGR